MFGSFTQIPIPKNSNLGGLSDRKTPSKVLSSGSKLPSVQSKDNMPNSVKHSVINFDKANLNKYIDPKDSLLAPSSK
jgi:hypothetical protein